MLNYLRSEWYRTVRRKYLYFSVGVVVLLAAAYFALIRFNQIAFGFEQMLPFLALLVPSTGFYAILLVNDAAFSDEHKHGTMKNTISYGVSRPAVYFGKLLNCLVFCILSLAALVALIIGAGILLGGVEDWQVFWENMEFLGKIFWPAFRCGFAARRRPTPFPATFAALWDGYLLILGCLTASICFCGLSAGLFRCAGPYGGICPAI